MCGIAGFIETERHRPPAEAEALLKEMALRLKHRGPDHQAAHWDQEFGVGFAHARLSILDLSDAAHQPMQSKDHRWSTVFNGEIYNFNELRASLEQAQLRTHSDTEILLEYVARHGVKNALEHARGMFALALWDRHEQTLWLARDRFGEKPLYYGWLGGDFVFGSDLFAFYAHSRWDPTLSRDALRLFTQYSCVPSPLSIFEGFAKLPPAHFLKLERRDTGRWQLSKPEAYWSPADVLTRRREVDPSSEEEILTLLESAVSEQQVADVPLGAFLSGGIDSSLVVALLQRARMRKVKTFTIGFGDPKYNEAHHARAVAQHLGTDHHEMFVSDRDALGVVPEIARIYSEPFADSSQIPTYLVSKVAREHVTVSLSGDGGDELFGGYDRYFRASALLKSHGRIPPFVKRTVSLGMRILSPDRWDRVHHALSPILPGSLRGVSRFGDKIHKLARSLKTAGPESLYQGLLSHWSGDSGLVRGGSAGSAGDPVAALLQRSFSAANAYRDPAEAMMLADTQTYLPNDILVKVDRAAMAHSLETRAPFLDPRVFEAAWRLPPSLRISDGSGKRVLKNILERLVPKTLIDRPKMGFGIPIDSWLRGELRPWADALLDPKRLESEGYLDANQVSAVYRAHLSGKEQWGYWLWDILVFQAWLERHRKQMAERKKA
jgi:asparagine synthase (glutamine-hydrolysing)